MKPVFHLASFDTSCLSLTDSHFVTIHHDMASFAMDMHDQLCMDVLIGNYSKTSRSKAQLITTAFSREKLVLGLIIEKFKSNNDYGLLNSALSSFVAICIEACMLKEAWRYCMKSLHDDNVGLIADLARYIRNEFNCTDLLSHEIHEWLVLNGATYAQHN